MTEPTITEEATGPLRAHPANPRYFTDGTENPDGALRAVYLTGSHTWNNLVDIGRGDPPEAFDFDAYLDFLRRYSHNFIRLWTWDSVIWDTRANGRLGKEFVHTVAPLPWARTGPGTARDGKPRFDLTKFDPVYFERLRQALIQAEADFAYCNMVHSHQGWQPFETAPRPGAIDGGGWICRARTVRATPWPANTADPYADGHYAQALASRSKVVKVPATLFVHN